MSKAEFAKRQVQLAESLLDETARKRAASTGETLEKALAEVLRTPEGSAANAVMLEHWDDAGPRDVLVPAVRKVARSAEQGAALAKAQTAEQALERLAKADQRAGEPYEVAYDRVVRTAEGQRLYAEHSKAMEQAAR
jgi:hypothetical protein